jgi:uncharacterized protein (UPF0276 family)
MHGFPQFGVGISYRSIWRQAILAHREQLGCLEVIAEHYLRGLPEKYAELDQIRAAFPLIPHGIGLSFGTDAPLDAAHLRNIAQLVERIQPAWFSEHIAFTHVPGWHIGHLASLPFTHAAVDAVCRNIRQWRATVGVPLCLENIAYMVTLPGDLTEAQFLTEIVEREDCGLLLDLHNVYTNAMNHGYDATEFLAALPLHRVVQIHLSGGHDEDGYRVDSHSTPTPEPVWELLRFTASRASINAVIIEWDVQLPAFAVMQREIERAQAILRGECDDVARHADRLGAIVH